MHLLLVWLLVVAIDSNVGRVKLQKEVAVQKEKIEHLEGCQKKRCKL